MLQIMDDWRNGRPVYGHASYPSRYCWISCERNTDSIRSHMRRIGLDPSEIYHFSLLDEERRDNQTIDAAIAIARSRLTPSVLFIDGIHALCPGRIIDTHDVTAFLVHVHQLIREHRLTILATVASPKSRPEDSTTPPGERFIGSGSWASMSDSKCLIEPYDASNVRDASRRLTIMPSHHLPSVQKWEFADRGLLALIGDDDAQPVPLDQWLDTQAIGTMLTTSDIQSAGQQLLGLSRSTVTRWIKDKVSEGRLRQVDRGNYTVDEPSGRPQ